MRRNRRDHRAEFLRYERDKQRAHDAGCNVFLPKPYLPEQLIRAIRKVETTTVRNDRERGRSLYGNNEAQTNR